LQWKRGEQDARALRITWLGVALAGAAMLANPWGWRILEYPIAYLPGLGGSPYRGLVEWQPPGFGFFEYRGLGWLLTFQARFWILVGLSLAGIAVRWRKDPYLSALSLVTLAMAINARRFIPLFTVCSLPWIALCVDLTARWLRERMAPLGATADAWVGRA